jgi:hypothetical protein
MRHAVGLKGSDVRLVQAGPPGGCDDPGMASSPDPLQQIPNVGPAVARRLRELGFDGVESLRGQDPDELFERTCALAGRREDPCLLDTYRAVVAFADGGDDRPWWAFSRERLAGGGR